MTQLPFKPNSPIFRAINNNSPAPPPLLSPNTKFQVAKSQGKSLYEELNRIPIDATDADNRSQYLEMKEKEMVESFAECLNNNKYADFFSSPICKENYQPTDYERIRKALSIGNQTFNAKRERNYIRNTFHVAEITTISIGTPNNQTHIKFKEDGSLLSITSDKPEVKPAQFVQDDCSWSVDPAPSLSNLQLVQPPDPTPTVDEQSSEESLPTGNLHTIRSHGKSFGTSNLLHDHQRSKLGWTEYHPITPIRIPYPHQSFLNEKS